MKSPAYIRAFIDLYTLPEPSVNEALLGELMLDGLIVSLSGRWQTTAKGTTWLEALRNVPLPEQVWVVREAGNGK